MATVLVSLRSVWVETEYISSAIPAPIAYIVAVKKLVVEPWAWSGVRLAGVY